jgi:hypothetical protein
MDYVISYNEIAALVANPPSLAPRPHFTNLRNLRRHIQRALMRVSCPQSNILGWAGLIMSRAMYGLTPHDNTVPASNGPGTAGNLLSDQDSDCRLKLRSSPRCIGGPNIPSTASHRAGGTGNHRRELHTREKLLEVVYEYTTCSLQLF